MSNSNETCFNCYFTLVFEDGIRRTLLYRGTSVDKILDMFYAQHIERDGGVRHQYNLFQDGDRDGKCETLKAQMMRASIKHGSKLFILDPLTDFLRSMGTDVQEDFMMWQKQQTKNGFVFINILHTRKPPTDKEG
jgi:hypothetical protein